MNHVMFDLETLGTSAQAPIVQLAAVLFDPNTGDVLEGFDYTIDPTAYWSKLRPDFGTIKWWLGQSPAVIDSVFNSNASDLKVALEAFTAWLEPKKPMVKLWSHATFDPPVLVNAYDVVGLKVPVPYKSFLDIRTLEFLRKDISGAAKDRPKNPNAHNAYEDCVDQARYVAAMLKGSK